MAKILLIEDEVFVRDLYQRQLEKANFTIQCAKDGPEGLLYALQSPDLILLDIMLPGMNGIDLLKQLKSNLQTSSIPVILLTNLGQAEVIKQAYNLGAQGYLLKLNTAPDLLIEVVKKFLSDPKLIMSYNKLDLD